MHNTVVELQRGEMPVTLEEVKRHLRVTNCDFDEDLDLCLQAALSRAETVTGQMLRRGRWAVTGSYDRRFDVNIYPVHNVSGIQTDGNDCPPSVVDKAAIDGHYVILPEGVKGERVTVTIEGGMGNLPFDIRAAVLMIAGSLFEHPADCVEKLPSASFNLLKPYKKWK